MASQGYKGSLTIGGSVLGVVRASHVEKAIEIDTTNTASATATVGGDTKCFESSIQGPCRVDLSIEAQWDSDGAGDPPNFDIFGSLAVVLQAGKTFTGNVKITEKEHAFEAKGVITYRLTAHSTGAYTMS